jgi:hypothetical protein
MKRFAEASCLHIKGIILLSIHQNILPHISEVRNVFRVFFCIFSCQFFKIYVEIPGIENSFSTSFFPNKNMLPLDIISAKSETLYNTDSV